MLEPAVKSWRIVAGSPPAAARQRGKRIVGKGHPDYYQDVAETIARQTPGAIYINQFANPANPRAHETGTGPELIAQMDGEIDAIVVGVGSGGTLTGVGRCVKSHSLKTEMILADPAGSVLAPYVETGRLIEAGSWAVEGIGEDFVPPNADLSLVARAYSIADPDSFEASRELLRREGILAGSSSGTLLAAALRYCKAQDRPKRVVSFVCDSGAKYLSKVFNPTFIAQEGWDHRELHGTVRTYAAKQTVRRPPPNRCRCVPLHRIATN